MQTKMYSIFDSKAKIYHKPWHANTHGEAERQFATLANDSQSKNLHDYPEDFDLFYVGDYDDNTGLVQPLNTPQHLVKAVQLKQTKN